MKIEVLHQYQIMREWWQVGQYILKLIEENTSWTKWAIYVENIEAWLAKFKFTRYRLKTSLVRQTDPCKFVGRWNNQANFSPSPLCSRYLEGGVISAKSAEVSLMVIQVSVIPRRSIPLMAMMSDLTFTLFKEIKLTGFRFQDRNCLAFHILHCNHKLKRKVK